MFSEERFSDVFRGVWKEISGIKWVNRHKKAFRNLIIEKNDHFEKVQNII